MKLNPVTPTAKGPASTFTGDVYVNMLQIGEPPSRLVAASVRFTPGARTHWHSHALGQTLHCTDGVGFVATRDGHVIVLRPGRTVHTPPDEDHWHGATAENFMAHLAILEAPDDATDATVWLEPVTDEQFRHALDALARE